MLAGPLSRSNDVPLGLGARPITARSIADVLHASPLVVVAQASPGPRRRARRHAIDDSGGPRRRFAASANAAEKIPRGRIRRRPILRAADEAHLPAEEAQAGPHPRLPRPHAAPAGAARSSSGDAARAESAWRRSDAAGRGCAPKRRRLSRSGEFDRVYREGESSANPHLVLYSFPREDPDQAELRLGVSAGRKIGRAVERKRVKRALREAFWSLAESLPSGHDFVVVARPEIAELVARDGVTGVSGVPRGGARRALGGRR